MTPASQEQRLHPRLRVMTLLFIAGLVISGTTAIPLEVEVDQFVAFTNAETLASSAAAPGWALWLVKVQSALRQVGAQHPFLFYGTDWLAFGRFAIAIAFIGTLRDPVRNRWLYTFGLIACAMVVPYALLFGALRGIPIWWRLVDCSFGVLGFIPLWFCRKWAIELETGFKKKFSLGIQEARKRKARSRSAFLDSRLPYEILLADSLPPVHWRAEFLARGPRPLRHVGGFGLVQANPRFLSTLTVECALFNV